MAWMAAKLVSSKRETRYASAASWRAMTAEDWKRRSVWDDESEVSINMSWTASGTGRAPHLEVLGDFTDETLEGELADEQLGGLLVAPDFTERDGSGPETMRLLDTSGGGLRR